MQVAPLVAVDSPLDEGCLHRTERARSNPPTTTAAPLNSPLRALAGNK